jgi:hypothetical protein
MEAFATKIIDKNNSETVTPFTIIRNIYICKDINHKSYLLLLIIYY